MKKNVFLLSVFSAIVLLLWGWASIPCTAEPIELNLVSYTPKNSWNYITFESEWVKKFNERAKGELVIKYRGGPETIGMFDQAEAVGKGAVDMALVPAGFFGKYVPGADMFRIPDMTVAQWRKDGTFEYMQELYGKKGLRFVGWLPLPEDTKYFWIVSSSPLKGPEDIKGKKYACSPAGRHFFEKMGATPIVMGVSEFYTAVERGVADGNWIGIDSYVISSQFEVASYVVDNPFGNSTNCVLLNLKRWNAMSDQLKKLVTDIQLELEQNWPKLHAQEEAKLKQAAAAKGAKFIKWSPEDAKWLQQKYEEAMWDFYGKLYGPEITQRFKQIWGIK